MPIILNEVQKSGLVLDDYCGIRDPSLWSGNSSAYGLVGDYDPYGGQGGITTLMIILIVIAILLILLCIPYCICRQKRYRKYKAQRNEVKNNGSCKSIQELCAKSSLALRIEGSENALLNENSY